MMLHKSVIKIERQPKKTNDKKKLNFVIRVCDDLLRSRSLKGHL